MKIQTLAELKNYAKKIQSLINDEINNDELHISLSTAQNITSRLFLEKSYQTVRNELAPFDPYDRAFYKTLYKSKYYYNEERIGKDLIEHTHREHRDNVYSSFTFRIIDEHHRLLSQNVPVIDLVIHYYTRYYALYKYSLHTTERYRFSDTHHFGNDKENIYLRFDSDEFGSVNIDIGEYDLRYGDFENRNLLRGGNYLHGIHNAKHSTLVPVSAIDVLKLIILLPGAGKVTLYNINNAVMKDILYKCGFKSTGPYQSNFVLYRNTKN